MNSEIHLMLDVAMENKEEFIFAVNQSTDLHQLKQIINDICITECVTNFDNITDHTQFAKNISEHNCGQLVNSLYNHKEFIGFSCSNSILDSFQNGTKILLRNIINKNPIKQFPVVNEMELMKKMQGGNLNFEDMLYAFKKVEEIGTSSIGSMLGIKITPDIIKGLNQQKAIINSMTKKERNNPTIINQSRIERISKGSGVSIEMVKKLCETINYMKGNAGNFMKMMSNPSMMANFLGKSN